MLTQLANGSTVKFITFMGLEEYLDFSPAATIKMETKKLALGNYL